MTVDEDELKNILDELARLREQVTSLQTHNSKLVEVARDTVVELEGKLELARVQGEACGSVMLDLQQDCVKISLELERFKRGEITTEEIHNMCHPLSETVSREEFAYGCRMYQMKLYGKDTRNFTDCVCTEHPEPHLKDIRKIGDPCQWCGGTKQTTPEVKLLIQRFEADLYTKSMP